MFLIVASAVKKALLKMMSGILGINQMSVACSMAIFPQFLFQQLDDKKDVSKA